jgi:tetratricopeptide (TPR) repeat protein
MSNKTPNHKTPNLAVCALAIAAAFAPVASQAATPVADPAKVAAEGRHAEAERLYDAALAANPRSLKDRIGRGFVRAWQKKYADGAEDFRAALAIDPRNLEAQNGLAYTQAWAGRFGEAEAEFGRSLQMAPGNFDASKGLAYVALWRGDAKTAVGRFAALAEKNPGNAELLVALGNARRAAGDEAGAREAYQRALAIEPGRADARQGLAAPAPSEAAAGAAKRFEVTALGGRTDFGDGTSSSGLRFAQFSVQASDALRVWAIYDSGLSRDNAALAARNADADAYYLGGFLTYSAGTLGTRLELGTRDLGNNVRQTMARGEQVFFLRNGLTPKLGFWVGRANNVPTETTLHAGLRIPVTAAFSIEPTVFRAENAANEKETRVLLGGEYRFANGATLGAGYADGSKSNVANPAFADSRKEVLLSAGLPLTGKVSAALQAKRESGANQPDTELIALGLTVRF